MESNPFCGRTGLRAHVHEQEAAGPVGVLGVARRERALAEEGGLLISRHPGDGDRGPQPLRLCRPDHRRRGAQPGQDLAGDAEEIEQVIRPFEASQVEQHGARGVAVVGDVVAAAGESPDQEAVDRAGPESARRQQLRCSRPVGEEPFDLGGAEVRVETQARPGFDGRSESRSLQLGAAIRRPAALPHDGVPQGGAGLCVPQEYGLPLVGDADGGQIRGFQTCLLESEPAGAELSPPYIFRIVLHPSGLRVVLGEFFLCGSRGRRHRGRRRSPGNSWSPGRAP